MHEVVIKSYQFQFQFFKLKFHYSFFAKLLVTLLFGIYIAEGAVTIYVIYVCPILFNIFLLFIHGELNYKGHHVFYLLF